MAAKRRLSPIVALAAMALLLAGIAVVLILWLPLRDGEGAEALSKVKIGPIHFEGASLHTAVADLNREVLKAGETRYRFHVPSGVSSIASITLKLDGGVSATECSAYVAELCGLERYSTAAGIVMDHERRDYRSWRKKFRDWIVQDEQRRWGGRMPR